MSLISGKKKEAPPKKDLEEIRLKREFDGKRKKVISDYKFLDHKNGLILVPFAELLNALFLIFFQCKDKYSRINNRQKILSFMVEMSFPESLRKYIKDLGGLQKLKDSPQFLTEYDGIITQSRSSLVNYLNSNMLNNVQLKNLIKYFLWFEALIKLDLSVLLRHFDAVYPQNPEGYQPHFDTAKGKEFFKDLSIFESNLLAEPLQMNEWGTLRFVLNRLIPDTEIREEAWLKMGVLLEEWRREKVLEVLIKEFNEGGGLYPKKPLPVEQEMKESVKSYAKKLQHLENSLHLIKREREEFEKVNIIRNKLFQKKIEPVLRHYTRENSRLLGWAFGLRFPYADILTDILAFNADFYKDGLKPVIDILLLKGRWKDKESRDKVSQIKIRIDKNIEAFIHLDNSLLIHQRLFDSILKAQEEGNKASLKSSKSASAVTHFRNINQEAREVLITYIKDITLLDIEMAGLNKDINLTTENRFLSNWNSVREFDLPNKEKIPTALKKEGDSLFLYISLLKNQLDRLE